MKTTLYLYFKGECEAALRFYEGCGLGTIVELRRHEGTPLAAQDGGAWREKVLHSVFEGPSTRLCASDGPDSEPMKGCAIFLELDDVAASRELFDALSSGGRVTVPFKEQFWGDHHGNFTDRFGVQWAMNCRRLRAPTVALHQGDRGPLLPLFRIADDSEREVEGYYRLGEVLVLLDEQEAVGLAQLIPAAEQGVIELKSLALSPALRGRGLGRRLLDAAIEHARSRQMRRLVLSTGAADTGLLRFYQRAGLRMLRIERDAFGPLKGYPEGLEVDGVPLRDQVWFSLDL